MKKSTCIFTVMLLLMLCMTGCRTNTNSVEPTSVPVVEPELNEEPAQTPTTEPEATVTPEVSTNSTQVPTATEEPDVTPELPADPTAVPEVTKEPTVTVAPEPTEAPKPTATPKPLADVTYDFKDLKAEASWNVSYEVEQSGALKLDYVDQWGEARFALPEPIDMIKYNKVSVILECGKGATAVKLYDKDLKEVFVEYNCMSDEMKTFELYPYFAGQVKYIGFMAMEKGSYTATIKNIAFHVSPEEKETIDITYDFNDLYAMGHNGVAGMIRDDGSLYMKYGAQYGNMMFVLPQEIDLKQCEYITVNAKSEDGKIRFEMYDDSAFEVFMNGNKHVVQTEYGWKNAGKHTYKCYPRVDDTVYAVAFTAEDVPAPLSKYEATIYDITFHMKPDYNVPKEKEVKQSGPTLKNTYGTVFEHVGTAVWMEEILNKEYLGFIKKHFNTIVAACDAKQTRLLAYEYGGGPVLLSVEEAKDLGYIIPESYKEETVPAIVYTTLDTAMRVAAENDLYFRFHTLVWDEEDVGWFHRDGYSVDGAHVSPEVMDARFEFYIRNVVTHLCESEYRDTLCSMDVMNEYLHFDDGNGNYVEVYGKPNQRPEDVKTMFQLADEIFREYGMREQVELIFNDFYTFENEDGLIDIINFFNEDGKICDGIGMQSHMSVGYSMPENISDYGDAINAFAEAGLEIQVTELDIRMLGDSTETDLAKRYYDVLTYILEAKKAGANISHLIWWGFVDETSWLKEDTPLMFYSIDKPKEAYYSALEAYEDAGYQLPK